MKLQIPKKYIQSKDDDIYIIAAPEGVPELAGYVMRIPQRLITGRGPTILVRHGNEKDVNGKTCHYRLDKEPDITNGPSQPHRYTTTELQALYDRAELVPREVAPETLTGSGRLVNATYAAPVPGTRLKREKTASFVILDGDREIAYALAYTPLRGVPVNKLTILKEYCIDDVHCLLETREQLQDLLGKI